MRVCCLTQRARHLHRRGEPQQPVVQPDHPRAGHEVARRRPPLEVHQGEETEGVGRTEERRRGGLCKVGTRSEGRLVQSRSDARTDGGVKETRRGHEGLCFPF
jgi:hypothetical protein